MKKTKLFAVIMVTVIATAATTIFLDNFLGIRFGSRVVLPASDVIESNELLEKYSKLEYILSMVENEFYRDTDQADLLDGAYKGVMEVLDDPHSAYYTAEEYEYIEEVNTGSYGGIGVVVTAGEDGKITVISPIEDTPGERAGILPGDKIITVDGIMVFADGIDNAVSRIKGEPGTEVVLGIERGDSGESLEISVVREKILLKVAKSEMLDDRIGYLRLVMFDSKSYDEFKENLESLRKQNAEGLILDLRNNPGGDVDECVKIADEILGRQTIVTIDYGEGEIEVEKSDASKKLGMPLVILANGNSASSSEILIGAVKDTGSGIVVGETTFGKGVVQSLVPLNDGSAVKMTIATYKTPDGNDIHKKGIEPDVEIALAEEIAYDSEGKARDEQLEKAIEIMNGLIKE